MFRSLARRLYARHLERLIEHPPQHIAVIQDGNRRYAKQHGKDHSAGHRAGAETTVQVLRWCQEFDIDELTLYAFSTENFDRPPEEQEALFDLIERKLIDFATSEQVHRHGVSIRVLGDRSRLPDRVQTAINRAESSTADYDSFVLNIALAYGGRETLLSATRDIAAAAAAGHLDPAGIDIDTIEQELYEQPVRDVDLIIRTGGAQRTSNFLPWHANGNEAAVFFCTPYWPSFSRIDFLRGLRTYEAREESWRRTRTQRAITLLRGLGSLELPEARSVVQQFNDTLPTNPTEDHTDSPQHRSDL